MLRRGLACAGALYLAAAPAPAAAEIRRLEAVGVAPIGKASEAPGGLRQSAFEWAVRDAVRRVADEQLEDVDAPLPGNFEPAPAGSPPETPRDRRLRWIDEALGESPLDYATRFRILEDRGERRALFSREPGVEREYVVVVEVHVDADRVRERLASRGLPLRARGEPAADGSPFRLVVDLASYRELRLLRRLLLEELGARSAVPVEMERGRVTLEVVGAPASLARALLGARSPEITIEALDHSPGGMSVRVRLQRPPEGSAAARPRD